MRTLLLALIISLLQFLIVGLQDPTYPADIFLYGNLQIIVVIGFYQFLTKYIYIPKD